MTALKKYDRLEASGLWRASPQSQRREVIVSIGDATLMISDLRDRPITHWSLAAIERANPGKRPALYHPDGDPGETLELDAGEHQMIDAIEKLRRAVERARPRPGRLRWFGMTLSMALVLAAGIFWLPQALITHTLSVVPQVKRVEIGNALLARIERMTGPACANPAGLRALTTLRARLGTDRLSIMPGATQTSLYLPGGHILLNRALVEDFEEPDVVAGYAVVAQSQSRLHDPLRDLLEVSGTWASFQLVTTGALQRETLDAYAEYLLTQARVEPEPEVLVGVFSQAQVRSTPYAYARDISGESVLPLIEADPLAGKPAKALLSDADWLRLQGICGG
ncbi:hypothetical protein ROLI_032540 [Roseobacter fucihabitans]|uniref:Uncharacterized protein n=1 Tax=Roseobacter fucihabitans TaxID=1537242 RepID=A0ABZ2BWQ8_9RHOB|nr:hypothetical protein [Roseobacter litoralis]MBC6965060.1 hypothetical protein [Roseobacter litoralis]